MADADTFTLAGRAYKPVLPAPLSRDFWLMARLRAGEFVVRAAAVKHWGADLLASMNAMRNVTIAPIPRGIPSFSDGGLVEGMAGAGADLSGRLEVVAGEGTLVRWLRSPNGQRELVRLIQANKRGVRSALGN